MHGQVTVISPNTPILPKPSNEITLEDMEVGERTIAISLPEMHDINEIENMRRRAAALEEYFRGKQAHLPALGVQRRLEARIGQLLGPTSNGGRPSMQNPTHAEGILRGGDRADFRILARALDHHCELTTDDWRQSRRALVKHIKEHTDDREAMLEAKVEEVAKECLQGSGTNKLKVREGQTIESLIDAVVGQEADGMRITDAAMTLGMRTEAYSKLRDVVMLDRRGGLSVTDTETVNRALDEIKQTQRVVGAQKMIQPIAARVWGTKPKTKPLAEIDAARMEQFDHGFTVAMGMCTSVLEIEIPYLSKARADKAKGEIDEAITCLKKLQKRIKELHK